MLLKEPLNYGQNHQPQMTLPGAVWKKFLVKGEIYLLTDKCKAKGKGLFCREYQVLGSTFLFFWLTIDKFTNWLFHKTIDTKHPHYTTAMKTSTHSRLRQNHEHRTIPVTLHAYLEKQ